MAQVRPIRFHDLRHTTASLLLQAGASIVAVSTILGHADVRITLDRYGHLAPDFMRAEMDKLRLMPPQATAPVDAREVNALRLIAGGDGALVGREGEAPAAAAAPTGAPEMKTPGVTGRWVHRRLERETGFEPATLSLGS
ncbi:MAG: tyrosine-type recombinase/integrase [Deltaproteobacteria bacterium]|nr:tyrosine-type recombinase/integrase [Deltaproteobacteria bacterium]